MQSSQQTHPVLTVVILREVSSQWLTVYQKTRPKVSTQLDDQRILQGRSPFDQSVSDDIRCVSVKKCYSFYWLTILHHQYLRFSVKSMQQLTLLFVLDISSIERSFVDDFLILSILSKVINLQHIISQSETIENTKSHCADRDVSLHLPKAISIFRCPWCRFWASVASHRNVSSQRANLLEAFYECLDHPYLSRGVFLQSKSIFFDVSV